MNEALLEISNLEVSYGGIQALHGLSLKVPKGSIVTLIGANGAGKSTLIKLLCRFYDPSEGKILINGIDLKDYITGRWDWESLRQDVIKFGVRNSTLLTCMPTASSAQIMGNSDTMEPLDSCIYKKRVLSGEYIIANKYLVRELTSLGLWNKQMKDTIIANNGSIQDIPGIPDDIKKLYKTVWNMSMKSIISQSAERGVFIDMTQSCNLFMMSPNYKKLTSMHFYAWEKKLKTGIYYLRQNVISGGKFAIDPELEKKLRDMNIKSGKEQNTTNNDDENCEMCSA